jgi:hypothetical protein
MSEASRRVGQTEIPPLPPVVAPTPGTAPTTDRAVAPPTPTARARGETGTPSVTAATGRLTRDSSLDEAMTALAEDMTRVPGIERFSALRLQELERAGPRPLRLMWRLARPQLEQRFGDITIGELLTAYNEARSGGQPPA